MALQIRGFNDEDVRLCLERLSFQGTDPLVSERDVPRQRTMAPSNPRTTQPQIVLRSYPENVHMAWPSRPERSRSNSPGTPIQKELGSVTVSDAR